MYQSRKPAGGFSRIHHRRRHCRRLAGAVVRAGRPRRDAARAQRRSDDALHQPLGRRHAGALLRERGRRADHLPARPARARPVARANCRTPRSTARWWWRMRATATISSALRKLTSGHRRLDAGALAELEPSLEGRFRDALFFADEGHVEPRRVLPKLHERIIAAGGTIKFNSEPSADGHRRPRDRLPRAFRARRRSRSCAASRAN